MADSNSAPGGSVGAAGGKRSYVYLAVLLVASAIYLGCIVSPPSLMDDVDSVQAQIARNMLTSGDWVTARLDGVDYFEKAPFVYWAMAGSYRIFGVHDWSARIPIALSSIALAWLTAAFAAWAFGKRAGLYAGSYHGHLRRAVPFHPDIDPRRDAHLQHRAGDVGLSSCARRRRASPAILGRYSGRQPRAGPAVEKPGLGGVSGGRRSRLSGAHAPALFPPHVEAPAPLQRRVDCPPDRGALAHSGYPAQSSVFLVHASQRAQPVSRLSLVFLHQRAVAAIPESALPARLQHRSPLPFLDAASRLAVSLERLLPRGRRLSFKPVDRAGRTRLLALCWAGFVLVFFTFSTTQEYYSMPLYPALALLLGSAIAMDGSWVRWGTRALSG
jgi:hypothetical protein